MRICSPAVTVSFPWLQASALLLFLQPNPPHILSFTLWGGNGRCCILCRKRKGVSGGIKGTHGRFYSPRFISAPLQCVLLRRNILRRSTEQTSTAPRVKENFCHFLKALRCRPSGAAQHLTQKFSLVAQQHMSHVLLQAERAVFLLREKVFGGIVFVRETVRNDCSR